MPKRAMLSIALAIALTAAANAKSPKLADGANGVPADKAEFMRRFDSRFKTIDKNGDGSVTKDELAAGRKRGNPERVARMFELMDRDRDGKVSQSEWRAAGEKIHERRLARKSDRGAVSSSPPPANAPGSE